MVKLRRCPQNYWSTMATIIWNVDDGHLLIAKAEQSKRWKKIRRWGKKPKNKNPTKKPNKTNPKQNDKNQNYFGKLTTYIMGGNRMQTKKHIDSLLTIYIASFLIPKSS